MLGVASYIIDLYTMARVPAHDDFALPRTKAPAENASTRAGTKTLAPPLWTHGW